MKKSSLISHIIYYIIMLILFITMVVGIVLGIIFGEEYYTFYMKVGLLFFFGFGFYGFVTQFKENDFNKNLLNHIKTLKPIFKIPLSILSTFCHAFSLCGFILLFAYGGGPAIRDGAFCIVSHGDFVREITEREYEILSLFDRFIWIFAIIPLGINFLIYLKKKISRGKDQTEN